MRKLFAILLLSLAAFSLAYAQGDEAIMTPMDSVYRQEIIEHLNKIRERRPTVAVVLAGGGAKGAAHVGVLEQLNKYGIPIDLVVGTSMGGLMGSVYALGHKPEYVSDLFNSTEWDLVMNDKIPYRMRNYADKEYRDTYQQTILFNKNIRKDLQLGRVYGMQVSNLISGVSVGYQDSTSFAKFPIPFVCVATDIPTGKEKRWYGGKITEAMRSTMSIPGVFEPVRTGNMLLVDGWLLNNLPTDVARDLGADVIIAVNLGDNRAGDEDKLQEVMSFAMTLFALGWQRKMPINCEIPDITVYPNISGYGTMSFDKASMDTLRWRGDAAAKEQEENFMKLKKMVGADTTVLYSRPAEQVITGEVKVKEIEYQGVSGNELKVVRRLARLDGHDMIGGTRLRFATDNIYGSKAFNSVTYEFLGHEDPYKLVLHCDKGPKNQIGFSARLDSEEILSTLFFLGLNTRTLWGPAVGIAGKIGLNPYVDANFYFRPSFGPVFNVNLKAKWVNMSKLMDPKYTELSFSYANLRQELYISESIWSQFEYNIGFRNDWYSLTSLTAYENASSVFAYGKDRMDMMLLFAETNRSTLDDGYFPTRGYKIGARYDWIFYNSNEKFSDADHVFNFSLMGVLFPRSKFQVIPSIHIRSILGNNVPIPYRNVLGGSLPGRYLDQQIPFLGIPGISYGYNHLGMASLALRYRIMKHGFLSAVVNGYTSADKFGEDKKIKNVLGAGLEFGYATPVGPIKAQIGTSNETKHIMFGFSFGRDF